MKKLHKLTLASLPVVVTLPTIGFVTSCSQFDYAAAAAWFKTAYAEAKETYASSGKTTASMKKALEQMGDVEQTFVENSVIQYAANTVTNLRKEKYDADGLDHLYGQTGDEREKIFLPLRKTKIDKGEWVGKDELIVDSNGKELEYYSIMIILNAFVNHKGILLKDLGGWAADLILAAEDISVGIDPADPEKGHFKDSELYAVVDANNIGNLFSNSKNKYPSPTLAMYDYYSHLEDDSTRFNKFYTETLNLNIYWEMDKKINILMDRMNQNFYLYVYTEEYTSIKWDTQGKAWVKKALKQMLQRIEKIIKKI